MLYDQEMVTRRPAIGGRHQLRAKQTSDLYYSVLKLTGLQPWLQVWISGWGPLLPAACPAAAWRQSPEPVGSSHCTTAAASLAGHQIFLHVFAHAEPLKANASTQHHGTPPPLVQHTINPHMPPAFPCHFHAASRSYIVLAESLWEKTCACERGPCQSPDQRYPHFCPSSCISSCRLLAMGCDCLAR